MVLKEAVRVKRGPWGGRESPATVSSYAEAGTQMCTEGRPPPGRAASGGAARPHLGLQPPGQGTERVCGSGHLSEGLRDGRLNELTRHAGWAQLPTGRVSASTLTVSAPHTPSERGAGPKLRGSLGTFP